VFTSAVSAHVKRGVQSISKPTQQIRSLPVTGWSWEWSCWQRELPNYAGSKPWGWRGWLFFTLPKRL